MAAMSKVNKTVVTPEKAAAIVKSLQFFYIAAQLIKVEFQYELVDAKFKNPAVNFHAKRIMDSANAIQRDIASVLKPRTGSDINNTEEYINELYRLLDHFIGMDVKYISDFMDGIDELKTTILNEQ